MNKVIVIGDVNLDVIALQLQKYPEKEKQTTLPKLVIQLGGSSAIFASACSVLGIKTKFIGRLGFDFISNFLIKEMEAAGVDQKIKRVEWEKAGVTISLTFKDMKRAMISFKGSNANFSKKDFKMKEIEGELIHIGGFNLLDKLREDVHEIFSYAKKKKMRTSLDPNWDPKGWPRDRLRDLIEILEITDFFFPDYEEGKAITKSHEPKKIISKLLNYCNGIVALKLGKRGCLVGRNSELVFVKGIKVKALQTTGAGDVFDAGFIKAWFEGLSLQECAKFANIAGALSTRKFGLKRFPKEVEIKKLLSRII